MALRHKSLVKESTSTTGTGNYTLTGAATGYRSFNSAHAFGAAAYIPYIAREGSGYEIGIGLLSAATTLQRTKILESSNANAAVNWAVAPTIYCAAGAEQGPRGIHNLDAIVAPVGGDNYLDGFGIGSLWIAKYDNGGNSINSAWLCIDDGSATAGSAQWALIFQLGVTALLDFVDQTTPVSQSVNLGSGENYAEDASVTGVVCSGDAARARWKHSRVFGMGYSNSSAFGAHQHIENLGFALETTDASPTIAPVMGGGGLYATLPPACAVIVEATVIARCAADNTCKGWKVLAVIQRDGTSDPAVVDTVTYTVVGDSAGAAAWDIALGIDTANDALQFTMTGAAAKVIRWSAHAAVTQVADYS